MSLVINFSVGTSVLPFWIPPIHLRVVPLLKSLNFILCLDFLVSYYWLWLKVPKAVCK
jgi:hypothetical protein